MRHKAVESLVPIEATRPAESGKGSTRDAWRRYCTTLSIATRELAACIDMQVQAIAERDAEIAYLKARIRLERPKGSKSPLAQTVVDRIEHAVRTGGSTREVGRQFRVSAMTVHRIKTRMEQREREAVTFAADT